MTGGAMAAGEVVVRAAAEYSPGKISVWWDIDSCPIPRRRWRGKAIAENIRSALLKLGYRGPISFSVYGYAGDNIPDMITSSDQEISIRFFGSGSNDLFEDLIGWALDNRSSPANMLLISGEGKVLSDALNLLPKRGYNVMLALPNKASPHLFQAAKTVWRWTSLFAGGSPIWSGGEQEMEAEHLGAKTSIWWDIANCPVPRGIRQDAIARNIKSALANLCYSGNVSIFAYGHTTDGGDLCEIALRNVPSGESEKRMLFDLMIWALDNPPPANFLLISGDSVVFSAAMHHLVESGYNILLAVLSSAATLAEAAKTVWFWDDLLAGGFPIKRSGGAVSSETLCSTASQGGGEVPILMKKYTEHEYQRAKTSVWWDIEDCRVPKIWDESFAKSIKSALVNLGYHGPVSISAYSDPDRSISYRVRSEFTSTGISLNPTASGEEEPTTGSKYTKDMKMMVEMFAWALENAAPANILLISEDLDFCNAMEALERRGFKILAGSYALAEFADTAWGYLDLLAGRPPLI